MPSYLPSDMGTSWTGWTSVETPSSMASVLRLLASPGGGVTVLKVPPLSSVVKGGGDVDPSRGNPDFCLKVGLRSNSAEAVVRGWTDGCAGDGVVLSGSAFVEVGFIVEMKLNSVVALAKAAQVANNIQSTKHPRWNFILSVMPMLRICIRSAR